MGRKQKLEEDKKGKLSVTISIENYDQLVKDCANKSKLINWLLECHFNLIGYDKK